MQDLTSAKWIKFKGLLFFLLGFGAAALLLMESPHWKSAVLLSITIWSFCRCYYFAFYVIEKYVDPSHRFSGLWSFARYLLKQRSAAANPASRTDRQ